MSIRAKTDALRAAVVATQWDEMVKQLTRPLSATTFYYPPELPEEPKTDPLLPAAYAPRDIPPPAAYGPCELCDAPDSPLVESAYSKVSRRLCHRCANRWLR